MSTDYPQIAADVSATMQDEGMEITLRRPAGRTYDPSAGEYTGSAADTDYTLHGVKLNVTEEYIQEVGLENIQSNDELIYTDALPGLVPAITDVIILNKGESNEEIWKIINKQILSPTGTPVLFIFQVRS
jgi:hypothetical protein